MKKKAGRPKGSKNDEKEEINIDIKAEKLIVYQQGFDDGVNATLQVLQKVGKL